MANYHVAGFCAAICAGVFQSAPQIAVSQKSTPTASSYDDGSAAPSKQSFCDEVTDSPKNAELTCQIRNVWKRIPQTKKEERKTFSPAPEGKKVLDREAYELWRGIDAPGLSPDGKWVAYTVTSIREGGQLVVRATEGAREWRIPHAQGAQITPDSRFVVCTIAGQASTSLAVMSLAEGLLRVIPSVSSFSLPAHAGRYVAYTINQGTANAKTVGAQTLFVWDLAADTRVRIKSVSTFTFDPTGQYLAFAVSSVGTHGNGVHVRRLDEEWAAPVATGMDEYRNLTFDSTGTRLAFVSSKSGQELGSTLLFAELSMDRDVPRVRQIELAANVVVPESTELAFTPEGGALTFRILVAPHQNARSRGAFELWHWRDSLAAPRVDAASATPSRSYLAVLHLDTGRWVQLESEAMPDVLTTRDARFAVGLDRASYKVQEAWQEYLADVYLVNTRTGKRSLLRKAFKTAVWPPFTSMRVSLGGKYLLYFEGSHWFGYSFETGKLHNLTRTLWPHHRFDMDEVQNRSRVSMPIGIGGWIEGDKRALLYDRHDIWVIDPSGEAAPEMITAHIGRQRNTIFRVWPDVGDIVVGSAVSSADQVAIESAEPLLITAYSKDTVASGFWRARIDNKESPRPLLMLDKKLGFFTKAKSARRYLLTQETFEEFPDLWTGKRLEQLRRISDVNPQQEDYIWGSAELVTTTDRAGTPQKGVLYRPKRLHPGKKYPMVVLIYGHYSPRLHQYTAPNPAPVAWVTAPQTYVSRGYLIFIPDVPSSTSQSGSDRAATVVAAVQSLIDRGWVDESKIGVVGHSSGGFMIAEVITHTNIFRCSVLGAGGANFLFNASSFESLFAHPHPNMLAGASLWDAPLRYLDRSPIMYADRVQTPVLMLHNDGDNAVLFSQGWDLYLALRRNAKEVYLFNYRNEGHELSQYTNRTDWDQRMRQYLDYFLKGADRPAWMD